MPNRFHPFHPIIYVRGFAMTAGEIDEAVADPYMGFNLGSTKGRQFWNGEVRKFFFESPMVRLKDELVWLRQGDQLVKSDLRYDDVYVDGEDLTAPSGNDPTRPIRTDVTLPYQSLVVYRYYDEASSAFGSGSPLPIQHFARGLSDLILRVKALVCKPDGLHPITREPLNNGISEADFRVYLVAHSMGGLVCRAFLQNTELGKEEARKAVDKLFTYATPHNGIDLRIVRNVPGWSVFGEATNFNRENMAGYLKVPADEVSLVENISAERVFNLVGTNPGDYLVAKGISAWAAGENSDGLVRIENATTYGRDKDKNRVNSPRAFVHRSHSGHFGIVNSEEGYQNLTRFLFGSLRVDGYLDIDNITLPPELSQAQREGKQIRASYNFEISATVRGCQWQLHRRSVRENSAIFRRFQDLFDWVKDENLPEGGALIPKRENSPHLFSVFLDPGKSIHARPDKPLPDKMVKPSVSFAFDLSILVPDYVIDGLLFLDKHYEGGYIYRELILVEAFQAADGSWSAKYGLQSASPNKANKNAKSHDIQGGLRFSIPVVSNKRPGIDATLSIEARSWNV